MDRGSDNPSPNRGTEPVGHLEEHHGCRVPFSGGVVAATQRAVQERVQVRRRARRHCGPSRAGQREVEQHQVLGPILALLPDLPDAEVRGLDVPVVNPSAVEGDQSLQQVGAPPFKQVQRQSLPAAEHFAKRLIAGALQHQGLPSADLDRAFQQAHQTRVPEPGQHLGLISQPPRGSGVDRHLHDTLWLLA